MKAAKCQLAQQSGSFPWDLAGACRLAHPLTAAPCALCGGHSGEGRGGCGRARTSGWTQAPPGTPEWRSSDREAAAVVPTGPGTHTWGLLHLSVCLIPGQPGGPVPLPSPVGVPSHSVPFSWEMQHHLPGDLCLSDVPVPSAPRPHIPLQGGGALPAVCVQATPNSCPALTLWVTQMSQLGLCFCCDKMTQLFSQLKEQRDNVQPGAGMRKSAFLGLVLALLL